MYQLSARLYIVNAKIHCAGEYTCEYQNEVEVLARLHAVHPWAPTSGPDVHHEILTRGVQVCTELAANYPVSLF